MVALSIMRKIFLRLSYNAVCARLNRYFFSRKGGVRNFSAAVQYAPGAHAHAVLRAFGARIQSNALAAQFIRSCALSPRVRAYCAHAYIIIIRAQYLINFFKNAGIMSTKLSV